MYRVGKPSERGASTTTSGEDWSRRILLVVAPDDSLSECWRFAIQREFPSLSVEQVPTLTAACAAFEHKACLILVDSAFLSQIDLYAGELSRLHPATPIAVMEHDHRNRVSPRDIFASKVVRGVLPMNLKLDVWLSVVRLMLRGGEYYPFEMFQSYVKDVSVEASVEAPADVEPPAELANGLDSSTDDLDELTERETQILEMVARGLQNKIIAATLRLSEYTVKIHIHHIITKLGAHNRTEAAAIFHERRDAAPAAVDRRRMQRVYPSP
jgi:DNA-binding NarL/FixJ family response regulator